MKRLVLKISRKKIAVAMVVAVSLLLVVGILYQTNKVDIAKLHQPCTVLTYSDIHAIMGDSSKPVGKQDSPDTLVTDGVYKATCSYKQKTAKGASSDPLQARLTIQEVVDSSDKKTLADRFAADSKNKESVVAYKVKAYWNADHHELNLLSKDGTRIYTVYYGNKFGGHSLAQTEELADIVTTKL